MKQALISFILFSFLLLYALPVHAISEPLEKLKNGTVELITSPAGLFTETSAKVDESKSKFFGLFGGLISGTDHMIRHSISGMVDILTFPVGDL